MAYLEQTQSGSAAASVNRRKIQQGGRWLIPEHRLSLFILLGLIGGWEIAVALHWINAFFFPVPSTIARTLGETLFDGSLQLHLMATLVRLGTGLLLGGSIGLGMGILKGWSRRLCLAYLPNMAEKRI